MMELSTVGHQAKRDKQFWMQYGLGLDLEDRTAMFFLFYGHVLVSLQKKKITGAYSCVCLPLCPFIVDFKLTGWPQRAAVSTLGLHLTAGSPLGLRWLFIIYYQQKHSVQLGGNGSVPMMQQGIKPFLCANTGFFSTVTIQYSLRVPFIYCKHSACGATVTVRWEDIHAICCGFQTIHSSLAKTSGEFSGPPQVNLWDLVPVVTVEL